MAADWLTFLHCPAEHGQKIASANPVERQNRDIGRRAEAVRFGPNPVASLQLAEAVLMEPRDEWTAAPRQHFSQDWTAKLPTSLR